MKLIVSLNWTVSKRKRSEKSQKINNKQKSFNKANNKVKIIKFKSHRFLNKYKRCHNYKIHHRFWKKLCLISQQINKSINYYNFKTKIVKIKKINLTKIRKILLSYNQIKKYKKSKLIFKNVKRKNKNNLKKEKSTKGKKDKELKRKRGNPSFKMKWIATNLKIIMVNL